MTPGSPPSGGFRGFFKPLTRHAKKVFRPQEQASTPCAPSPRPGLEASQSQLNPAHEPPPQSLAQSQHSTLSPQRMPDAARSASTANLAASDGGQSMNAESRLSEAAKKAGADAWTGLKAMLQLVEKSSDVFPPLKSALTGFYDVVDIFETAAQNRQEYADLALNIQYLLEEFRHQPSEHTSSKMSEALKTMASGLEKEMGHVIEQRQRSGFRSHFEAGQDVNDIQECRRRVAALCRELQNKVLVEVWRNQEQQQADARLDKLNAALEAMYDSSLSDVVGRRMCTAGTRKAILAEMRNWADDSGGAKVYWLNGMAGTGKTTLAYSFCAEMQHAGRLGASFFCSRADTKSRDASKIVPTIAYQLACLLPAYRNALVRCMSEDKVVGARRIETQFQKLIRDPLRAVKASELDGIVVTIDALDECDRRDGAQDVLNVLLNAGDLPIRFFVTCRPEPGLYDVLHSKDERYRSVLHLHDIESSFVQADIKTYLEAELGAISLSWEKLELLAEQAGTLFIYAATAVRYIRPKVGEVNFNRRLEQLLSKTRANKHQGIDDLYRTVLAAPFDDENLDSDEKENIRLVLNTATCAREPMGIATMARLLELDDEQDVRIALQRLRSVLHVSQGAELISTLHASFPDFMLNSKRSKDLWCDAAKHHQHLSLRCFSTMQRMLRFNICDLKSSFVADVNVPHLTEKIGEAILPELFYACRYWADHLVSVEAMYDVHSALRDFLSNRLLFWMEVLNLNQCIHIGVRGLYRVQAWSQRTCCPVDVQQLVRDAAGFVTMVSSNAVSRSTPHIYVSALPFWPEQRPVSKHYSQKMRGLPKATGLGMRRRESAALAICVAPSHVFCVAYSSDSARVVSGSEDNMIRVWDAHTGRTIGKPLEGHTGTVYSVAYSSDDGRIVSGSWDNTIRIWDALTGKMIGKPLEGHTNAVISVAFSSDNARIVSGSDDHTIRIWDAHTGEMIGAPLEGHSNGVWSVAYSSDNARIVSGSADNTIRVWDAHIGKLIGEPLDGHTSAVRSVTFSSNNAHIVSGSYDHTIRVWDAHTGKMIGEPLEGHTSAVMSVAYSPDDDRIVSGSEDNTIRIWDAHTGKMVGEPLEGHAHRVMSVAYSPDHARIVSGSYDQTIRIWDAHTDKMTKDPLEDYAIGVKSVALSSNAARIVSASGDNAIRIWDAYTGKMIGEPLGGHTRAVNSVAYSTDDARIVSGSEDKTIRVWDAHTGKMIGEPLEGHASGVWSVAYSSDNTRIVSGSKDGTIRVWNAQTGEMIGETLEGHTDAVISVAFSFDNARIVSGSADNTMLIWDAHTGKTIGQPLEGHTSGVWSVAYSSDNARIVSGSNDWTIRVWDAQTGEMIGKPLEGHTDSVRSVAFSPNNAHIVSGSYDRTIRVWDAYTGKQVCEPAKGHTSLVKSVAFSSDDTRIVSGSEDGTIRVWDLYSGKGTSDYLEGHTDRAISIVYSPSEVRIDSDSFNYTIHLANFGGMSNNACGTWILDQDGYILSNDSNLLMWVPSDVRDVLKRPQNTAVIFTQGSVEVDFANAQIGDYWAHCYQPI